MLVRCVDEDGVSRRAAPNYEDVVLEGSDDDFVHLNVGVRPVQNGGVHGFILARDVTRR
jgi:hypothetical protein